MSEACRADHVGSFLRPAEVKEARAAFREGRLPLEQLRHVEDRAILAALERQRSIGVTFSPMGSFAALASRMTWWKRWRGLLTLHVPQLCASGKVQAESRRSRGPGKWSLGNCGPCGD